MVEIPNLCKGWKISPILLTGCHSIVMMVSKPMQLQQLHVIVSATPLINVQMIRQIACSLSLHGSQKDKTRVWL